MSFQSLDFAIFLPIVFIVHWYVSGNDVRRQNLVLLFASLVFYAWWDWRFLGLLLSSAGLNQALALAIESADQSARRKTLLWVSVGVNLSVLFLFKYFNFFVSSFAMAFGLFGLKAPIGTLDLILPLGLSFFTFQALGYTIDVYRGRFPAVRDPLVFLGFMAFFPKIVAGPIERASNLMPQFTQARAFDEAMAVDGLRRILLGLFMKVVVADNIGILIAQVKGMGEKTSGSDILIGILLKPIQIYADFAGYSEIAIGTAALFGFSLMRNFSFPFFATNLVMLWQRWHISLTSWFRDYVFMAIPSRRTSRWIFVRNISVIYILSGVWHGASWNYVLWGGMNALFIGIYLYFIHFEKRRFLKHPIPARVSTYLLFSLTLVPLFGDGLKRSMRLLSEVFSLSLFEVPHLFMSRAAVVTFCLAALMLSMEWFSRKDAHGLAWLERLSHRPHRWMVYLVLSMLVLVFSGNRQPFVYAQF